ncbi:MAG: flagellar hook assembly protein FlgD [Lentilitoribacter sp.]|mmetsp:Transcript_21613/g.28414  ORF Transcript_21613/g.28414 Transcript_21613/m.28414 type:complete len:137 (+) Transcript_21613:300-710(+)|eukprot:CAMPEP_0195249212 /NCGR_PEP_ID=MMETSP0706-20130129/1986_1 /TAXON_ID=33640 /ORGANISM="Asterionellopsis glacialis, Strain CCMP134" /LENGTH=136 /DNA_ID=CAMNT_0040300981 /DNA_START=198 /DNA_END=608 /DNA_ORIENTATION=+
MGVEAVSSATSTTAQSNATTASNKASLDYDTFLQLLIAQMQNQDPTEPMDSSEQIAQLATFSQVEQTIETNKNLEALLQSNSLSQASAIIGKTVSSLDGETTGVVKEVQIMSDGAIAVLEDGTKLVVGPGMVIKDT